MADMMAWALYCAGIEHSIHYLDDFLFFAVPNSPEGTHILSVVLQVFESLGVPVAVNKTEGPAGCVTFLGILIDTWAEELRLPPEKLQRLQELIQSWAKKKCCTRKELESFLDHLTHAASLVLPGRTFLRELFGLLRQVRNPLHSVRLTTGARADICWWKVFLQS